MPRNIIRIEYNVHDIQHCQCKKEFHSILLPCMFVDILTTQYILHTSLKFHQEGLLAINLSPRASFY